MSGNAIEMMIIKGAQQAAEVAAREVTIRANQAIGQMVEQINANPGLPDVPLVELHPPTIVIEQPPLEVDTKTDAASRAGRSFIGGLVATVLASVGTGVAQLASNDAFNPLDGSAWKTAAVGVGFSILYAGVSYAQRFLSTPKA